MIGLDLKALCCLGATCCASVGGYCVYTNRSKIPHPSECNLIGKCYLMLGYHSHEKFDLMTEIHEIHQAPIGSRIIVELSTGRYSAQTQPVDEKRGKCDIQERLNLHVRQCDNYIQLIAYKKGSIPFVSKTDSLGELAINVKAELIDEGFPKRRWYCLTRETITSLRVLVSFHRIDTEGMKLGELELSPLVQQALLHAQYEAESKGEQMNLDINGMTELEKLRFYSKVLEGPLKQMSSIGLGWTTLYFKPIEKKNGYWYWNYWNSKEECIEGRKNKGSYSFLAISLVLADKMERHCFFVKYHDMKGAHDLYFKRVDRDRNLWSDGLYEFIEKLRTYLEKTRDEDHIGTYIVRQEQLKELQEVTSKGQSKSKSPLRTSEPGKCQASEYRTNVESSKCTDCSHSSRKSSSGKTLELPPTPRRLSSPRLTQSSTLNSPLSRSKMAIGAMYEYANDDSENQYEMNNNNSIGNV